MRLRAFFSFLPLIYFAQAYASPGVTYHGRLLRPDGLPVNAVNVKFKIQVRTPGAENCLLFQETHVRDMSLSEGAFAITLNDGTASVVNTESFAFDRIFQNRGTFSFAGGRCSFGSSYAPASGDGRKLVVQFDDGSGWEEVPPQTINQVPQSLDSMAVSGFRAADLFRVVDGSGAPVAMSAWSQTDYTTLLGIVSSGNTSGNSAGFTGVLAGDVTGTQAATVVEKIQGRSVAATAPTSGQVLKWTGSAWAPGADSGATGSVLSVTGTGAVSVSGTTSDPVIGVDLSGVFANNAGLLVSDGTQLQNKACSANEILKWFSPSGWTCAADAGLTVESDPKVGANTVDSLSKWNGSALVSSAVFENGGNVGIGTTTPVAKFEVSGEIKLGNTSSACNSANEGQQRYNATLKIMQFCNGTSWTSLGSGDGVPAGMVAFFNLSSCPSGWSELVAARGRAVVGLPSGGALAGVSGTAFGNLENRGHAHSFYADTGGAVIAGDTGYSGSGYSGSGAFVTDTTAEEVNGQWHIHSVGGTTSVAYDLVPYIQLLACQKN